MHFHADNIANGQYEVWANLYTGGETRHYYGYSEAEVSLNPVSLTMSRVKEVQISMKNTCWELLKLQTVVLTSGLVMEVLLVVETIITDGPGLSWYHPNNSRWGLSHPARRYWG